MSNLRKVDNYIERRTGLTSSTMSGTNNNTVNGSGQNIINSIINDKIKKKSSFSLKGGNKLLKGKEYKIRTKIKTVIYA